MKKLLLIPMLALIGGCAHGKMGQIDQALDRAAITPTTPISVEIISAKDAVFTGDKSTDVSRVTQEKAYVETSFNLKIADELVKKKYQATAVSQPATSGIVITGTVTKIEHGSAAARMLVGMGSGAANMYTQFVIEDRTNHKILSKFEVIGTSGGRGGIYAGGSFLEAHLKDGAKKVAAYVANGKT